MVVVVVVVVVGTCRGGRGVTYTVGAFDGRIPLEFFDAFGTRLTFLSVVASSVLVAVATTTTTDAALASSSSATALPVVVFAGHEVRPHVGNA